MRRIVVACTLLMPVLGASAQAQQPPQSVDVVGCVSRGVELNCLIIKDSKSGKTYQINAASPRPDPARNLVVHLKGQIAGAVDFCQQGPVLTAITWSYTERQCPAAKPQ